MSCSHKIVEDLVDIDPDKSQQIFYCENCYKTFTIEEKNAYTVDPPIELETPVVLPPRV